jgi:putative FmdB family regulatory protein
MPIYEYQCTACHHKFDVLQKLNDEQIKKCPECSKNAVERLVSAAGFQLKGSGWYATDFKNKGKPEQKSDNSASLDTKAADKTKTEPSTSSSVTTKGESD